MACLALFAKYRNQRRLISERAKAVSENCPKRTALVVNNEYIVGTPSMTCQCSETAVTKSVFGTRVAGSGLLV